VAASLDASKNGTSYLPEPNSKLQEEDVVVLHF
jgi:hypothetical protein